MSDPLVVWTSQTVGEVYVKMVGFDADGVDENAVLFGGQSKSVFKDLIDRLAGCEQVQAHHDGT